MDNLQMESITGRLTRFVQMWYMQLLPMLTILVSCSAFFNEVEDSNDPFILPQSILFRESRVLYLQYASSNVFDGLVTIGVSMALFLPLTVEMIVSSGGISFLVSLSVGGVDDWSCICMPSERLSHRILVLQEIRWTPD